MSFEYLVIRQIIFQYYRCFIKKHCRQLNMKLDTQQQPPNYPRIRHASHTFSHSPSAPQIISYLSISAQLIIYFVCLYSLYQNYILLGIFSGTFAIMILCALICSCTNPTDRIVYAYKWSKCVKNVKFQTDFTQNYFCQFCDSFCALKSKHCRVCNRCTSEFDHHCIWINNCIGSSNYKSFFMLILVTFINFSCFIVGGAIMSYQYARQSQKYRVQYAIPVWVMMVVLGIMAIFLLQLIILHIYLQVRGISTYEFLQQRRRAEQQERQKQKQRQRQKERQRKQLQNRQNQSNQSKLSNANQLQNSGSNVKIKVTPSNTVSVRPKIKLSQEKLQQKYEEVKRSGKKIQNQNQRRDQLKIDEGEQDEEMPQFLKKNKSLKIIFGSAEIEAPRKSSKKINRYK